MANLLEEVRNLMPGRAREHWSLREEKRVPGQWYTIGEPDPELPFFSTAVTHNFKGDVRLIVKGIMKAAGLHGRENIHNAIQALSRYAKQTGDISTELADLIGKAMTGGSVTGRHDPEKFHDPEVAAYAYADRINGWIQKTRHGGHDVMRGGKWARPDHYAKFLESVEEAVGWSDIESYLKRGEWNLVIWPKGSGFTVTRVNPQGGGSGGGQYKSVKTAFHDGIQVKWGDKSKVWVVLVRKSGKVKSYWTSTAAPKLESVAGAPGAFAESAENLAQAIHNPAAFVRALNKHFAGKKYKGMTLEAEVGEKLHGSAYQVYVGRKGSDLDNVWAVNPNDRSYPVLSVEQGMDSMEAAFPASQAIRKLVQQGMHESVAGAAGPFAISDAPAPTMQDQVADLLDRVRNPRWEYPSWALPKVELDEVDESVELGEWDESDIARYGNTLLRQHPIARLWALDKALSTGKWVSEKSIILRMKKSGHKVSSDDLDSILDELRERGVVDYHGDKWKILKPHPGGQRWSIAGR